MYFNVQIRILGMRMRAGAKRSCQVACTLPIRTYEKIGRLIEDGMFLNYSDFARTAIENELARIGAMPYRDRGLHP